MRPAAPHQIEAGVALGKAFKSGYQRVLLSHPTGAFKTDTTARFLVGSDKGVVVVLTHAGPILDQWHKTLVEHFNVKANRIARIYGEYREDPAIASWILVTNLCATSWVKGLKVRALVVDEADRAAAPTYCDWMSALGCHRPDGPRVIHLSATPYRRDNGTVKPLTEFGFSRPRVPVCEAVTDASIQGALVRSYCDMARHGIVAIPKRVDFDTRVRVRLRLGSTGDVSEDSYEQGVNTPTWNRKVARAWLDNRREFGKTMLFVRTRSHAVALAKELNGSARFLIDGMSKSEIDDSLNFLRSDDPSEPRVLVSCKKVLYGYDAPDVKTVMPPITTSPNLYVQAIGRGARVIPGIKKTFNVWNVKNQWDGFEHFLAGVHDLANGDGDLIEVLSRRAAVADASRFVSVADLLADVETCKALQITSPKALVTEYAGFATTFTAEGVRAPVGALLKASEFDSLARIGVELAPDDKIPASDAPSIERLREALADGLYVHLERFDIERDIPKLKEIRTTAIEVRSERPTLILRSDLKVATNEVVIGLLRDAKQQRLGLAGAARLLSAIKEADPGLASYGDLLLARLDECGLIEEMIG